MEHHAHCARRAITVPVAHGRIMAVSRDEIGAPPGIIIHQRVNRHARPVAVDISVPAGHTVPHVQQLLNPAPQPPVASQVYPVAAGPILNMVPVLLTVFAIGISVTLHVYNI